jgi:glycosyltransferase involved in cell wall biosynthesis
MVVQNVSVPRDRRVWPECLALRELGLEVEVICPSGLDCDLDRFEWRDGVAISRFPCRPSSGSTLGYGREYASAVWHVVHLVRQRTRAGRFDVVHAANPPDLLLPALSWLKRGGTRFVFDHHDLSPELYTARYAGRAPILAALRLLERTSFALADVVIATNESFRDIAIRRGGVEPDRVFVVRNAPDTTRLAPEAPDPDHRRGARFLLVYVGLIEPRDGVETAIDALADLHRTRTDWRALIVGDGPGLPAAKARARALGLDRVIDFPGFVDDLARLRRILASADVCLSPEPKDPLNDSSTLIKVAEYMAMAKPIVAFDLAETRVTAGASAAYATPNDPKSYANEIHALLDDPARRARMGAAGRERVEQRFGWEHSKRALKAAYACALDHRPIPAPRRESTLRAQRTAPTRTGS